MIPLETVGAYAVTWFTVSLMIAGIAEGKNRSALSWFLVSFVLTPPIAIFLLVVVFRNLSQKVEEE